MLALPLALALGANSALADGPCEIGRAAGGSTVLTLAEAAALLRVDETELAAAVARGEVPGRQLAGEWRFARAALIAWLAGAEPSADCFGPQLADRTAPPFPMQKPEAWRAHEVDLPARELSAVTGARTVRGPDGRIAQLDQSDATDEEEAAEESEPERFGEEPEADEAREVALREQAILVGGGELTIEPGFSYTSLDDGALESYVTDLALRYGLTEFIQLSASLPFIYQTFEEFDPQVPLVVRDRSDASFGDVSLGLSYRLLQESVRRPAAFVTANGSVPTDGSNRYGLGGGISLVKNVDPTSLFTSLSYLHLFNVERSDAERRLDALDAPPDDLLSVAAGFALRMNDELSFSAAASGSFTVGADLANLPGDDDSYRLSLALTWLLRPGLFVEPSVVVPLNRNGVTFALSVPYTFDLTP